MKVQKNPKSSRKPIFFISIFHGIVPFNFHIIYSINAIHAIYTGYPSKYLPFPSIIGGDEEELTNTSLKQDVKPYESDPTSTTTLTRSPTTNPTYDNCQDSVASTALNVETPSTQLPPTNGM